MNIIINRHRYTRHGVDGTLSINGAKVCDTTEHPSLHLPAGLYQLKIRKHPTLFRKVPYIEEFLSPISSSHLSPCIRPGHGPFLLTEGSIIIGQRYLDGVLLHSDDTFAHLFDRLDKAQIRKESILLNIK